jgi:cobalamin biosynthesis protein CobT
VKGPEIKKKYGIHKQRGRSTEITTNMTRESTTEIDPERRRTKKRTTKDPAREIEKNMTEEKVPERKTPTSAGKKIEIMRRNVHKLDDSDSTVLPKVTIA